MSEVRTRLMIFSLYKFCPKDWTDQRPLMFWISHYTLWYCTVRIPRWVFLSLLKIRLMLVIHLNRFILVPLGKTGMAGVNKIQIHHRNTSDTSSYRVWGLVPFQAVWKPSFENHSLCAGRMLHHIDIS